MRPRAPHGGDVEGCEGREGGARGVEGVGVDEEGNGEGAAADAGGEVGADLGDFGGDAVGEGYCYGCGGWEGGEEEEGEKVRDAGGEH